MQTIYRLFILYSLIAVFASNAYSNTLSEAVQENYPDAVLSGQAKYSKFGFSLYRASLWGQTAEVIDIEKPEGHYPLILSLDYLRSIKKERLISSTAKQLVRLGTHTDSVSEWSEDLETLWVDVNKGSTLTAAINLNETVFYSNGIKTGEIRDPNFGSAFINIWLSEETVFPKQRLQLLGK